MVAGAAARQGTLALIRSAIQMVLQQAKRENLPIPGLRREDYEQKKRPAINWNDPDARAALLQELVNDADTCHGFYDGEEPKGSEGFKQRLSLLSLVATQDVTKAEDGKVTITQGTAPDRIISTVDPEMRHGRKTTSSKFDGYKTHLAAQNVAPTEGPRLITAVVVTGGNVADGDVASALLKERQELTGAMPNEMMGDTSYGSTNVAEKVAEVAPDIKITAPVPPSNNRHGLFPKTAFIIDTQNLTVTCPAGQTTSYQPKRQRRNHKADQVVIMDSAVCAACPMREQCVKGKGARTIRVRADEAQIQERRAKQETDDWKIHYNERSRIEHVVNAEITRHGGRQGRYWVDICLTNHWDFMIVLPDEVCLSGVWHKAKAIRDGQTRDSQLGQTLVNRWGDRLQNFWWANYIVYTWKDHDGIAHHTYSFSGLPGDMARRRNH